MKIVPTNCHGGETGEVFTLPHVASYMIREARTCGHFQRLHGLRILEPSCGEGVFVLPLVEALIAEKPKWDDPAVVQFLTACDISEKNIERTKAAVRELLLRTGCPRRTINRLLSSWFICTDFLLHDFKTTFDLVIGNPPYIRFDSLSAEQQRLYRTRYETFSERCDIYVPFFERGLSLLSERGVFSFICANRFVRSSYGRKLRAFISANYHVALYLNLEHADPFVEKVSAYPAIYLIDRRRGQGTCAATIDDASEKTLATVTSSMATNCLNRFEQWYAGDEPWTTTDAQERIEADLVARTFPTIEKSALGTALGIGVATGADEIFLDPQNAAEIESECLLPLVTSTEIRAGEIVWDRRYMLNPYDQNDDRVLFELERFPKAAAYIRHHAAALKARYCARQHPDSWYRTLDRIKYSVWKRPKIFLPDIQLGGNVALDEKGEFYPHHNVYWIASDAWNLKALCVILRSSFVTNQIRRVSVQMRGGSIRYQAQNLRNVHVPAWKSLNACDVENLESVFAVKDVTRIDAVVHEVLSRVGERQCPQFRQGELFAV